MKIITITLLVLCLTMSQDTQEVIYQDEQIDDPLPEPSIPQPIPQAATTPQHIPPPSLPPIKFNLATLKIYQNEVLAIVGVLIYLLMYIRGKKANVSLMQRFYRRVSHCIEANFSHIGFSKTSGQAPFNGESPSQSTYYATGRDNVDGFQMRFSTKKRQDLLYCILDIFMPEKDTVTIDIPVKTQIPLVLALISKKILKEQTDKNLDLRTVTMGFKLPNLPSNYQILGQSGDTVENVIDKQVVKKIKDLNGLLLSFHYTDLKTFSDCKGQLRMVLNLAHKQQEHFLPAVELALYLADKIAGLKLTANAKAKALKSRESYNQSKEKQEMQKHRQELKKKKEQKLRQEQAWLRSLPPEKQKREQQKRKKKEFNKMTKGKTMKM